MRLPWLRPSLVAARPTGPEGVPAAADERPAGVAARPRRRLPRRGRIAVEVLLAALTSAGLAAAMTWPALRDPSRTIPQDLGDPLYFVWSLGWTGHALRTDPLGIWTTNAFSGAADALAYTDTMIGYAPLAALGTGFRETLAVYNLVYAGIAALAFFGGYLLARAVGARWPGALVAAAAIAYAPWRLGHDRHLNVISTGGIALALALLVYGHGWTMRRGARSGEVSRPLCAFLGWLVACWQLSLSFAVGIPFAWALLIVLAAAGVTWLAARRRLRPKKLLVADAAGGLAFALTGWLLAGPYLRVVDRFPVAQRTEEMLGRYSPPVRGLITAPPESTPWGGLQAGLRESMNAVQEQTLLPGFVLLVLGLAGLVLSTFALRFRLLLAVGVLLTGLLALGVNAPGEGRWTYLPLFHHLPGFEALRTPGRMILYTTLLLGLLAAGAVSRVAELARGRDRTPRRATALIAAALLVPAALVVAEGTSRMTYPRVPDAPVDLAATPAPLLVLPTSQGKDFIAMAWSTDGFPPLVNGGSGFEPPTQSRLRRDVALFPDPHSVAVLRRDGVRTVVVDRSRLPGTPWEGIEAKPVDGLGLQVRSTERAIVYTL